MVEDDDDGDDDQIHCWAQVEDLNLSKHTDRKDKVADEFLVALRSVECSSSSASSDYYC